MPAKIDIVGQTFEYLLVLEDLGHGKVICKCTACGSVKEYYKKNVKDGSVKSCGCINKKAKPIVVGEKYYHWTVLEDVGDSKVRCQCDCENKTERILYKKALREGSSQSCGCKHGERCNATKAANGQAGYGDNISGSKYVGQKFGRLLVKNVKDGKFICDCDCGTKDFVVYEQHVLNGMTKSCGCLKEELKLNLVGKQFGYWVVIDNCELKDKVLCRCVCGTERLVYKSALIRGRSQSCGCMRNKLTKDTMLNKYGDICTLKIDNPREQWQIDTVSSKESLEKYIRDTLGKKITYTELSKLLGIHRWTMWKIINKYHLEKYIDHIKGKSVAENEIAEFINGITCSQVLRGVKYILGNQLELDIYIPNKRIAIEFNGIYQHSTIFKDKNYHKNKTDICEELGIHLIHIFENEWYYDRDKIMKLLYNNIADSINYVNINNCDVKLIGEEDAEYFIENNNGTIGKEYLGIRYNNEDIGVITISIMNNRIQLGICSKSNISILGNMKNIISSIVKRYKINEIYIIADRSKEDKLRYISLGFKAIQVADPNRMLVSRKLDESITSEKDISTDQVYYEIYGSGFTVLKYVI